MMMISSRIVIITVILVLITPITLDIPILKLVTIAFCRPTCLTASFQDFEN